MQLMMLPNLQQVLSAQLPALTCAQQSMQILASSALPACAQGRHGQHASCCKHQSKDSSTAVRKIGQS